VVKTKGKINTSANLSPFLLIGTNVAHHTVKAPLKGGGYQTNELFNHLIGGFDYVTYQNFQ
jgi:hypothetical protein